MGVLHTYGRIGMYIYAWIYMLEIILTPHHSLCWYMNGTFCIQEMSSRSTCPTFPTLRRLAEWRMHLLLRADIDTLIVHVLNVWWTMPMHSMMHRGGGVYNFSVSTCSLQTIYSE
jgi:hypothetical protein